MFANNQELLKRMMVLVHSKHSPEERKSSFCLIRLRRYKTTRVAFFGQTVLDRVGMARVGLKRWENGATRLTIR